VSRIAAAERQRSSSTTNTNTTTSSSSSSHALCHAKPARLCTHASTTAPATPAQRSRSGWRSTRSRRRLLAQEAAAARLQAPPVLRSRRPAQCHGCKKRHCHAAAARSLCLGSCGPPGGAAPPAVVKLCLRNARCQSAAGAAKRLVETTVHVQSCGAGFNPAVTVHGTQRPQDGPWLYFANVFRQQDIQEEAVLQFPPASRRDPPGATCAGVHRRVDPKPQSPAPKTKQARAC